MENRNNFTEGSILKKLVIFMLPILASLILQAMYGAVDTFVIGMFGYNEGLSGVLTGSSIINLIIFTIAGFTTALTVQIAKYLGEKNNHLIGKVIGGAVCLFIVVSLILTILLIVFAPQLAIIMKSPKEALTKSIEYVRICGGGILFIIFYNVISSIFRGLGNSKLPLLFVGISCIVNIVLDLLFVIVFKMDVIGVALATVIAQAVSVILSIIIICKQKLPFTFKKTDFRFNSELRYCIKVGFPIALQEFLTNISFTALVAFINDISLDASNGYAIANRVTSFIMLIPSALMQSMSSFVAQNVGAGKEKRAKKSMYTGMLIGSIIGILVTILTFFKGDLLSSIFTSNPTVINSSFDYLKGFALEAIVTCILFSFIGYYSGHGQTLFVMIQGLAQTFIVRLPMSYIMSILPNPSLLNIGLSAPAATIFGITINVIYFIIYNKKAKKKQIIID